MLYYEGFTEGLFGLLIESCVFASDTLFQVTLLVGFTFGDAPLVHD